MKLSRRHMVAALMAGPLAGSVAWPALAQRPAGTRAPSRFAIDQVARICGAVGITPNFTLLSGDVEAAQARLVGTDRQIIYSEDWLRQLEIDANSAVPAMVILAHEIGHHINGHTLDPIPADTVPPDGLRFRVREEQEADIFAGGITARLGYRAEEGLPAFDKTSTTRTIDHPSRKERQDYYTGGWDAVPQLGRPASTVVADAPEVINVYSHNEGADRIQSQFKGKDRLWHEFQDGEAFADFEEVSRDPCGRISIFDQERGVWIRLTPSKTGFGLGEFGIEQGVTRKQYPKDWSALDPEWQDSGKGSQSCVGGQLR